MKLLWIQQVLLVFPSNKLNKSDRDFLVNTPLGTLGSLLANWLVCLPGKLQLMNCHITAASRADIGRYIMS